MAKRSESLRKQTRGNDHPGLGIESLVREILIRVGEDPGRQGLLETPRRVSRALEFLTRGYRQRVEDIVKNAVFKEKYDEMVIVKDIDFYSLCEHHLLPFFGHVHIAYLPDGRLIGLSKIPRIVELYARRLQLQERMTVQIAECIHSVLRPKGVAVVVDAQHLCISMRGIEKQHARTVTSAMLGAFRNQMQTREEFLALINMSGSSQGT